jgi:hypothetical protein
MCPHTYTSCENESVTLPVLLGSNAAKDRAAVCRNRQLRMYSSRARFLLLSGSNFWGQRGREVGGGRWEGV